MNEIEYHEILTNVLAEIKKSMQPFLLPINILTQKASQFSQLSSTIELLVQAEQQIPHSFHAKQNGLLAARDIPFGEVFSLLKDCYSGKINDHLQNILESAEIELAVKKREPNKPQSPKQLEITIRLAAAVIDKYADLLTMVIGKKSPTKEEQDIIKNASATMVASTRKLQLIHLRYGTNQLEQRIYHLIEEHKASHCLPFFCTGKTIGQYQSLASFLNNILAEPLSADELAGGLYTARFRVQGLSDTTAKGSLTAVIDKILKSNDYPIEEKNALPFIRMYRTRMEQLNSPSPLGYN